MISLLAFLGGCDDAATTHEGDPSLDQSSVGLDKNTSIPTFDSLSLDDDPFIHSSTKDSQTAVVKALFNDGKGYRLPGSGSHVPEALLAEIREGYFLKTEGIDEHIRREYHTFTHALDVMITTHALLRGGGGVYLHSHEQAALVFAALGHDILHSGVNNAFLIKVNHPLVSEFGIEGLQEKRSANHVLALLDKHGVLAFKEGQDETTKNAIADARAIIEQSILWTDMKRHNDLMKQVTGKLSAIETALKQARETAGISDLNASQGATSEDVASGIQVATLLDDETRILLGAFILHCADVSNPTKNWEVCERWTVLVMNEFFSQGDIERKLGNEISMNCDRKTVSIPRSQLGFGKYVIRSLFQLLEKISYTSGKSSLEQFEANHKRWEGLAKTEAETGKPYQMHLRPPSREGGWIGELREGE